VWLIVKDQSLTVSLMNAIIDIMAKVTGKFQITLPKAVAEQCGIRIGDELQVRSNGRSIQLDPLAGAAVRLRRERLAHFDQATARQRSRQGRLRVRPARSRSWTREELYRRGRTR
jgi:AbrB family looped-hinge helix DNA binding protein